MAVRIKSHWHDDEQQRSFAEIGGALAFNSWKLALDKAITLHGENFVYRDDRQRLAVIMEYLIFAVQVVDRLAHQCLEEEARQGVVTAMALKLAEYLQDNARELLADDSYQARFIEQLNQRAAEYADFTLSKEGPSYPFYRHLGYVIQQVMGREGENRWVIDQVMDLDGPQLYKLLRRITRDLLPE